MPMAEFDCSLEDTDELCADWFEYSFSPNLCPGHRTPMMSCTGWLL